MKFALVNDRTPGCDHDCYADHRKSAVMALASFAKVSLGLLTPSQMKERSEAER
jgi:hypothetical protein